jgi:hypothetical protein
MIRIAVDLFLLEPEQYRAVSDHWPEGAEFARVRDMAWPGPEREIPPGARLIQDMIDPEEIERERREEYRREMSDAWRDTWEGRMQAAMREERALRRAALRNDADISIFWLPNVTENNPLDPEGRHWYPFSAPPPERQQWMVWREIGAARIAWLAWPYELQLPAFLPERIPGDYRFCHAPTPRQAIADALKWTQNYYRRMPYTDYLTTPHWLRTRDAAVSAAGHRCEECKTYHRVLDAHHLTYERRGQELPTDLRVLCRDCHERVHESPKGDMQ